MEGYEVAWSQDGAAGLDMLRRLDPLPMLILLDLMMRESTVTSSATASEPMPGWPRSRS